jgi:hypothetical protein
METLNISVASLWNQKLCCKLISGYFAGVIAGEWSDIVDFLAHTELICEN